MFKRFVVIFVLMCLGFCLGAQIPKEKQAAYKLEVEIYATTKFYEIKKEVDKDFNELMEIYKKYVRTGNEKYRFDLSGYDVYIEEPVFNLYVDLVWITNKYVPIAKDMPATDFTGDYYTFLYPYLESASVNIKLIEDINRYSLNKVREFEKITNLKFY